MQIVRIFLLLILFCGTGAAQAAMNCTAVRWPYSVEAADINNIKPFDFEKFNREYLYSYLYFEISQPPKDRIPGLAKKLFYYLKNSEVNQDKHNFVGALEWAADLDTAQPRVITTREVCNLIEKMRIANGERTPDSVKGRTKSAAKNSVKKEKSGK